MPEIQARVNSLSCQHLWSQSAMQAAGSSHQYKLLLLLLLQGPLIAIMPMDKRRRLLDQAILAPGIHVDGRNHLHGSPRSQHQHARLRRGAP